MVVRISMAAAVAGCSVFLALAGPASAKPARCFTTDDGQYPCTFTLVDKDGSFQISARGKPTFILNMDGPGRAYGLVNFGERNIFLPGTYTRDAGDKACWVNTDATNTRICAW
ncbi:hypothetical protein [Oryzicola mucosus]|nr:hypothetical protein [Oryzicola mucosus]